MGRERRKRKDIWARMLIFLNIAALVLLLSLFFVFHRAQPEFETLFDRFYKLKLRTEWDLRYLYYLLYLVSFSLFFCLSGLLLSAFRGRRKDDHYRVLIITGVISFLMLIIAIIVL